MVAFNRRFAPHFARLEREIRGGRIGQAEILRITSYDPAPPTIEFVRRSGGIFRDMMIHDLDMACWLLGEEPIELFATASVMVDPAIGEAGDVDTAVVTLRMKSGALCQIANTRRAVYGYDQRIEVLGSKGGISAENVVESTVVFSGAEGIVSDKPLPFFLQRYAEAYRRELDQSFHYRRFEWRRAAGRCQGGDPRARASRCRRGIDAHRPSDQIVISQLWRASRYSESARSAA
jgi:myo-inositol 2-dehydrogenase/D-chiro-inositol 1-dehydrogenase